MAKRGFLYHAVKYPASNHGEGKQRKACVCKHFSESPHNKLSHKNSDSNNSQVERKRLYYILADSEVSGRFPFFFYKNFL